VGSGERADGDGGSGERADGWRDCYVPTDMGSFCGESANGSGNQKSINPIYGIYVYGIYDRRLRQYLWHSRPQTPSRTGPLKLIYGIYVYGIYDRRLRQYLWHSRPQTPSRTGPLKLIRDRDPVTDPLS
jgi:hypothetical protein